MFFACFFFAFFCIVFAFFLHFPKKVAKIQKFFNFCCFFLHFFAFFCIFFVFRNGFDFFLHFFCIFFVFRNGVEFLLHFGFALPSLLHFFCILAAPLLFWSFSILSETSEAKWQVGADKN